MNCSCICSAEGRPVEAGVAGIGGGEFVDALDWGYRPEVLDWGYWEEEGAELPDAYEEAEGG